MNDDKGVLSRTILVLHRERNMDALGFILLSDNMPFAVALCAMALFGVVSAIGLDFDADGSLDLHIPILDWVNPGRLPMLAALTVMLCIYGVVGLAGQQTLLALTDHTLDALPAGLGAALPALIVSRPITRGLAKILPRDETSAINIQEIVGKRGSIEIGKAMQGHPARARFIDNHGQQHLLMVEPTEPDVTLEQGQEILLISIEDNLGRVIAVEPNPLFRA